MLKLNKGYFKRIDIYLILPMVILIGIGILAISSATSYSGESGIVSKQITFFVIGLLLMVFVMNIDYHWLGEWYIGIYIITVTVLLAVLLIGASKGGATRWIDLGFIQLQPSEFAKIAIILCTSKLIAKHNNNMNSVISIGSIGLFQFIPFILINLQPNLSTSLVVIIILIVQMFVSNLDIKCILSVAIIGILSLVLVLGYIIRNPNQKIIEDYQRNRIVTQFEGGDTQGDYYQTSRSIDAIGSGGLYGKGLYQGAISQLNYLPEAHNDFVVAIIGEEFGFIGICSLISVILILITRGIWVAYTAQDDFGKFIVAGYIGMIATQSFINMGVVTSILPNTGLPLPFVSYGGSSLWANMIGMGLVLNVSMKREETMF
ncbi:rod shape-determining protein RodA [Candidatus Epulonipiscium fishelsonii]|uniref:Rod shape-determining protein RodA n=1 Tax=Candidatus Epulonipiscium fishelsonii TaxID=77094 RepID=A0ACC8XDP2_9FIRM|nr:rod shape-determining protein RodA [Epulopiscium sp. SCG-B11WGA-EpuloA1]ONI41499.1 rod shape-determining protein RodA [Epulopiscium sp. SCG-B05WGA-EpuloA1]ONI48033.1 rod shape-determining protein RodA [Epulopiscium sp. SCG-C06WGA-EpuloA1]